jgi:hypothetical protein
VDQLGHLRLVDVARLVRVDLAEEPPQPAGAVLSERPPPPPERDARVPRTE